MLNECSHNRLNAEMNIRTSSLLIQENCKMYVLHIKFLNIFIKIMLFVCKGIIILTIFICIKEKMLFKMSCFNFNIINMIRYKSTIKCPQSS